MRKILVISNKKEKIECIQLFTNGEIVRLGNEYALIGDNITEMILTSLLLSTNIVEEEHELVLSRN